LLGSGEESRYLKKKNTQCSAWKKWENFTHKNERFFGWRRIPKKDPFGVISWKVGHISASASGTMKKSVADIPHIKTKVCKELHYNLLKGFVNSENLS
jgi:hypothetical protein